MKKYKTMVILLIIPFISLAQWGGGEKYPDLKPHAESMKQFRDMKFGMFVHWGPSAIRGTSSWARGNHPYDFAPRIPIAEYDSLYVQFNPLLFDAADWIRTARSAGMNYFIMVTKHHDGFCNWDSKYTDYDMMSTPYPRDVLKDLSEECRKQGLLFGTYYSICDWHHPEYPGRYGGDPRPVEDSDMEKYMVYMKGQLNELIDDYHTNILWFDGYWEGPWTHEHGMDLYKYLRGKKADLLINNRVDRIRADAEGKTHPEKYAGDYRTPEQEIGAFDIDYPWESCITVSDGWFWRPQGRLKSLKELITILVRTAGGGGNLLLNIGPMPDGRMELFQKKRLLQIGGWLDAYGESIYGTTGGPFKPNEWTASTRKGNRIYLHVLEWPGDTLVIPDPGCSVEKSFIMNGDEFEITESGDGTLAVSIPEEKRKEPCTVLVFETGQPADRIGILEAPAFKDVKTVVLSIPPHGKYHAEGAKSLIDGKRGSPSNLYENWLGFEGENLDATIDLQRVKSFRMVTVSFLQDQNTWIFLPEKLEIMVSKDDKEYVPVAEEKIPIQKSDKSSAHEFEFKLGQTKARYVKISATNIGSCPDWHKGTGGKAWLFVDEIVVE